MAAWQRNAVGEGEKRLRKGGGGGGGRGKVPSSLDQIIVT